MGQDCLIGDFHCLLEEKEEETTIAVTLRFEHMMKDVASQLCDKFDAAFCAVFVLVSQERCQGGIFISHFCENTHKLVGIKS